MDQHTNHNIKNIFQVIFKQLKYSFIQGFFFKYNLFFSINLLKFIIYNKILFVKNLVVFYSFKN